MPFLRSAFMSSNPPANLLFNFCNSVSVSVSVSIPDSVYSFILATWLEGLRWLTHGGDITNRRNAVGGAINPITVKLGLLRQKWKFLAGFDITATPSVADGVVYFPSWNGNLYAVDASNGALIWQRSLVQLTVLTPTGRYGNATVSRATPVVAGDRNIWARLCGCCYTGHGSTRLVNSARPASVGLSDLVWNCLQGTYTLPHNGGQIGGYSGAAIWGSSPSIDTVRGQVYVGTGNLYLAPAEVLQCQARQNNRTTPPSTDDQCFGPEIHFDSLMAFDINTGSIVWARQLGGYDVFYFACLVPNNPDCPPGPNLDADFGEAPMLITIISNRRLRDVVVAVQKSGFAWALDRDNGDIVWFTKAGPGSLEGGGVWGAATDGARVYTNIVNNDNLPFTLKPSTQTTTSGGWVAMDANTGRILWTTANPSNESAHGPVTVVNGVLFAGSVAPSGPVYAMDARTGAIIWSFEIGATIYGGVSVSYGCVYIGHGYSVSLAKFHPTWNSGKYLFAFCIP
ncbi:hypothetical protein ABFX02_12G108100 [Erythranthe guttata]